MAQVRYDVSSELNHASLVQIGPVVFFTRVEAPQILPDKTDQFHTVTENDRLDNIAAFYYGGRPRMKWVIARANDIWLEPLDLVPGMTLRIPTQDRLRREGVVFR